MIYLSDLIFPCFLGGGGICWCNGMCLQEKNAVTAISGCVYTSKQKAAQNLAATKT